MNIQTNKHQENTSRAVANTVSLKARSAAGPEAQLPAVASLQEMANASTQVQAMRAVQLMADQRPSRGNGAIQRFKIKDSEEHGGYLAGDHKVQDPDRVNHIVGVLSLSEPMTAKQRLEKVAYGKNLKAVKDLEMVKAGDESAAQYISKAKHDETAGDDAPDVETEQKNVLVDGHHRFIAHVEADLDLPAIDTVDWVAEEAYHWSKMGDIDK